MTTLLTAALRNPFIRTWSTRSTATIAGGRTLTSTDDLIGTLPLIGAKTGHTDDAGWSQVAAVQGDGVRITASVLGSPTEAQRNADLGGLLAWGLAQYQRVKAIDSRRVYGRAETGYGRAPIRLVPRDDAVRTVRVGKPLVERVVAALGAGAARCRAGQRVGAVRVLRLAGRLDRAQHRSWPRIVRSRQPGTAGRARLVRPAHGPPPRRTAQVRHFHR